MALNPLNSSNLEHLSLKGLTMSVFRYRLPADIAELNLTVEKMPRQDVVFIKKNGPLFHWHVHETLQMSNNKVDNFETVYTTMVLLFVELGADEVILDVFRLALEIQVLVHVCCLGQWSDQQYFVTSRICGMIVRLVASVSVI